MSTSRFIYNLLPPFDVGTTDTNWASHTNVPHVYPLQNFESPDLSICTDSFVWSRNSFVTDLTVQTLKSSTSITSIFNDTESTRINPFWPHTDVLDHYSRSRLDLDMTSLLKSGQYQIVIRETDGERFVFPITNPEVIHSEEITDEIDLPNPHTLEDWLEITIPEVYRTKGHLLEWIRTDEFILNMKRPHLPDDHQENYVGRFSYHPETGEFLPSVISTSHNNSIAPHGSRPFNEYIRGIYVRAKKVLLLKAYYNPLDENGKFDPDKKYDLELDHVMSRKTLEMLAKNGLPSDIQIIIHARNNDVGRYTPFK